MNKFKVGDPVVANDQLVKQWGVSEYQLPIGVVAKVIKYNDNDGLTVRCEWYVENNIRGNSYFVDQLDIADSYLLDMI